jgi:hypothetical protein
MDMSRAYFVGVLLAAATGMAQAAGSGPAQVISGAVGLEEREAMLQNYRDYNLHLGFARPDGAFLSDVLVRIRDNSGNVVYEGKTDGPLLFAQLPPGNYSVTAEYEGKSVSQTAQVRDSVGPIRYFYLE